MYNGINEFRKGYQPHAFVVVLSILILHYNMFPILTLLRVPSKHVLINLINLFWYIKFSFIRILFL